MSARGRGGRGGGRGGAAKSFNRDQLNSLGVSSNETVPVIVSQPPALYPLLNRHPVPLTPSNECDYLLILKQDFVDHIHLSGSYVKMPETKKSQPELEIDRLVAQIPSVKEKYNWNLFPSELRPKVLAKRTKGKAVKDINIEKHLEKLEKIEKTVETDVAVAKEEQDEDVENETEIIEEDIDDEMDDGTDYANNYFDTGEDYEDEDDNLDDGPIY